MSNEIALTDIYGDEFNVHKSTIHPDNILFHVQEMGVTSSGELDMHNVIKLRDFLNEFIGGENE